MSMRLGYLVPEFPGQTHAFFWREVTALRAQGHTVELISTTRPSQACRHPFAREARKQTTYLIPPSVGTLRKLGLAAIRSRALTKYAAQLGLKPKEVPKFAGILAASLGLLSVIEEHQLEHIHVHSAANAAHIAALAHEISAIPFSITLHGDLEVYGTHHAEKMKNAAKVLAVTEPLRQQLVDKAHVEPERTAVVWMGVDTGRFVPPAVRQNDVLQLATIARLNRQKGHIYALRALKRLKDEGYRFLYTIAGSGEYQAEIEKEIAQLDLGSEVVLVGSIGEEEVFDLLQKTDVFVLPSIGLGEAAPVSVMEAMACGCAIVCSIIGGTPDMITHEKDGLLVAQKDIESLAAAFRTLSSPDDRASFQMAAREKAVAQFDMHNCAQKFAAIVSGNG